MSLAIDASHLHPSCQLALEALGWLEDRIEPSNILDMGCGNGMLALVAEHMWGASVLACDISEQAVADTKANIAEYAPEGRVQALRSDGLKHPDIRTHGPYDFIICNLLAQFHVQATPQLLDYLHPGGHLLLSGILLWHEEALTSALNSINIDIIHRITEKEWVCYMACHKTKP